MTTDIPERQREQSKPQKKQELLLARMSELYTRVALLAVREREKERERGETWSRRLKSCHFSLKTGLTGFVVVVHLHHSRLHPGHFVISVERKPDAHL